MFRFCLGRGVILLIGGREFGRPRGIVREDGTGGMYTWMVVSDSNGKHSPFARDGVHMNTAGPLHSLTTNQTHSREI